MIHGRALKRFRAGTSRGLSAVVTITLFTVIVTACSDNPNPHARPDESWITISGAVESVEPNGFRLDYGDGTVQVEMDDGDRDAGGYRLVGGDKVSVSGRIDDDFFDQTKIVAKSIYVENLGTTFFASSLNDEERRFAESGVLPAVTISRMDVSGTVSKVNRNDFLIDTGNRMLRVDVSEMPFDPLDDDGYLRIDEGDRVKVLGQIDTSLFEGRRLVAETVIEMRQP